MLKLCPIQILAGLTGLAILDSESRQTHLYTVTAEDDHGIKCGQFHYKCVYLTLCHISIMKSPHEQ